MANTRIDIDKIKKLIDEFKLTEKDFKNFNKALKKKLPKTILEYLKKETPQDTGETSRAWKIKHNSNGFSIINDRGLIIEFLMHGTRSHLIEPKDKSVLMFELPTGKIFTKFVNHPGYDPQMNKDQVFKKISNLIDKEVDKIVSDILKKRFKT